MQISEPLFRMAHLSLDGARVLLTFEMNVGKLKTSRLDLGQAFKTLGLSAGCKKTIRKLTWRLARRTRNIRNCREW
jgi:hypothetical protein